LTITEICKEINIINNIEKEKLIQNKYGYINNTIHCRSGNFQVISVGKTVMWDKKWITFPDFLMDYIKFILGKEWWNANIANPISEQHQIIRWHKGMVHFQNLQMRNCNGLYEAKVNSAMLSYLLLAYDLYTIDHNSELQKRIICRIQDKNQFQGALYELYIASLFIRAGFDIDYSDDTDHSQKHPEFDAKFPLTEQLIAIEAKSRHRNGLLGMRIDSNDQIFKLGITKLMNRASNKTPNKPFIVFIDINLPNERKQYQSAKKQLIKEIDKSYRNKSINDKFNLIFFTDHHPFSNSDNAPASIFFKKPIYIESTNSNHKIAEIDTVKTRILKSISQYGNIPNAFSDLDPYD